MADLGAEFLFQVIAERGEKGGGDRDSNLPVPNWTQVIPNPRLCKALHQIELQFSTWETNSHQRQLIP